jgi:hypothetical protein
MLAAAVFTGCADRVIQLSYQPDMRVERMAGGQALTVFRFSDARGTEGDKGDVLRVGGVYGGYGNRLAKVVTGTPWPQTLARALTDAFKARGVDAVVIEDQEIRPGALRIQTPLALGGEIRNFSTESRWTKSAHVGGILRLYDREGRLVLERSISARATEHELGTGVFADAEPLEILMNQALRDFVQRVVTDPEITQRLLAAR